MALLISAAMFLFGLLLAAALAIVCMTAWVTQGGHAARQLLSRWLVAGLPLLASMLFFCYAFLQDPLWPSQDMPKDVREAYLAQRAQVDTLYDFAAAFSAASLAWLVLRIAMLRRSNKNAPK